ncbi:MAG: condensation domain-containing protein [Actinomycetota bacterium]|nr:condensation domain-containing protein [Actinomycetota bacterium]
MITGTETTKSTKKVIYDAEATPTAASRSPILPRCRQSSDAPGVCSNRSAATVSSSGDVWATGHRKGESSSLPLTMLDESLLLLQETRASWNVQFELGTDHHLDETRLRQAVLSSCQRHPLARARLTRSPQGETSYQWDFTDEVDLDPFRVADCPDSAALDQLRTELYSSPIALDTTPGFRVVLARRPSGDLVLLSASHIVADGVGALRLMQTITRTYRGEPDPPDPLPLDQARDLGPCLAPKTRSEKWARRLEGLRRLREALDPPSRIAVVGDTGRGDSGFVFRTLDIGEATTPELVRRAPGTTVNDVLLAALHLTVQSWNTKHGASTGRVGVQMPVNVRPADRLWEVVSNLTSMVSVSTAPSDRVDLPTAVAAVAKQTYRRRRNDRAYGLYDLLEGTKRAPLTVKRAVPRLIHLTGDRLVDTAMLSNLGRIPEPPTLTARPDSKPLEVWFSPPCDPACSVAIGVATNGQRLALVTRYRYEQFDADAAEEFTNLLITQIAHQHKTLPLRCLP